MISCDTLLSLLEPPALYEFTDEPFWDDEHISARMLAAHLDPDFEGASRNHAFIDHSVAWITRVAPDAEYPRLLDLGCGPGLYAERLARAGYRVTGVDFSRRSITHARHAAEQQGLVIDYHYENYLALDLGQQFDIAIMIYCDYGALSAANRRTLLDRARVHLRPGGLLILDVFTRHAFEAFEEGRIWEDYSHGGFWRSGPHLEMQRRLKYDDVATLEQVVIADRDGATAYHLWNTYFTPEMLGSELKAAGFNVLSFAGDVAGSLVSEDSLTLVAVAQVCG